MSIRPDIQFGLNVNRAFSDIVNRDEAIENLGLKLDDLEIIRGSAAEGGLTRSDVRSLAGLDVPLSRYLTKLKNDVGQYNGIVNTSAGTKEILSGNLSVNGIVSASSIKYNYLEDETNIIKKADVSTSRVSSWSSPDSPPTDESPIFYGGDIEIGGTITTSNLNLFQDVQEVLFRDSEVPTHKIETVINGETVYLYAMKGIPLIIQGFFRNFDTRIDLVNRGAVSVRIVNLNDERYNRSYENLGGTSTFSATLIYRDVRAAQKNIEIYHPPGNIKRLELNQIGLESLPPAELEGLEELRVFRNLLREFPDFASFAPNLRFLDVRENDFVLADDSNLRSFNQTIVDRLPTALRDLYIGNTFDSSITGDLRTRMPELERIDLDSPRGSPKFGADEQDPSGSLPEVSDTVTVYTATRNRFKSIPTSVKNLPELRSINLYANDITDRQFSITSPAIEYVNTGRGNQINVADMTGKINLERYYSHDLGSGAYRGGGDDNALVTPGGNYKFANCPKLNLIYLEGSDYRGPIPKFSGNPNLGRVDLRNTEVKGGKSDSQQDYVIYPDIFDDCLNTISDFRVTSPRLIDAPIHPDAFSRTENIDYLYIRSFNRGVTGAIPDLSNMPRLRTLIMNQNNLTGPIPDFNDNPRIRYINFYANQLSGAIPRISQSSLLFLYLHYNNFQSFTGLDTQNLRRLFIRNNSIQGTIPNLSNLSRMYDCYINNNLFDSYTVGSFGTLIRLRRLDLSNNSNLSEGDINTIIEDLYQNYLNRPRERVTINIRNTATPTGDAVDKIDFLRENGWIIRT